MARLASQFPGLLIREQSSDNPDGLVWIEGKERAVAQIHIQHKVTS